MARPVVRGKVPFKFYKNTEGLNTNSTRFERRDGQCIENQNIIYPKSGGFKCRGGQQYVSVNAIPTSPELVYGIEFVRTEFNVTTVKKIAFGIDGRVYDFTTNPPADITPTPIFTTGVVPDVAVIHGWLCVVDGTGTPRKWDMTNWYRWGIVAPTTAPSVAAGAAGIPNGDYRFRVAFKRVPAANSIDPGAESSMGTISASVTVANQMVDLTNIPISTDPQVNARAIYVEIGGQWYLATTLNDNTTTTYSYNQADVDVVLNEQGRTDRNPPPDTLKIIEQHKDVTYGSDGRLLKWSILDEFEAWSDLKRSSNAFQTDDGTQITGIRSHIDLVVTKSRSLFVRAGDDVSYTVTKKINNSGCDARNSMVVKDGLLYYHAHDGFRVFDGNESSLIQRNIQNLINGPADERVVYAAENSRIVGCVYSSNLVDAFLWAVPTRAGFSESVFYYSNDFQTIDSLASEQRAVGIWSEWDQMDARFLFVGKDSATGFDKLYSCGRAGQMRELNTGFTDLGSPINPVYRQVDLFFGEEVGVKRLRDSFFVATLKEGFPTSTYYVEWYLNGVASGVQRTLNFCNTGPQFDVAVFDVDRFALEGTFIGVAEYGPDPFVTIAPRLTWSVSQQSDDVLWNGWTLRVINIGYRRRALCD